MLAEILVSKNEEDRLRKLYFSFIPAVCSTLRQDTYYLLVKGADHNSFTDIPLYKEFSMLLGFLDLRIGTIPSFDTIELVNAYLGAFFDKYLRNKSSSLLENIDSKFSEYVVMQKW